MTKVSNQRKSASRLLLLVLFSTLCVQAFSVRVSSTSKSLSTLESSSETSLESRGSTPVVAISNTGTTWFPCSSRYRDHESKDWNYNIGYSKINCGDNGLVGGYGSGESMISPILSFDSHRGVIVSFKLAFIDSWDTETFKIITFDGNELYSITRSYSQQSSNACNSGYRDGIETIRFGFNHTASTLRLILTSTLNEDASNEAWGVCDFNVVSSPYPVTSSGSPIMAISRDTTTFFSCSSLTDDNWLYAPGYSTITCSGNTYLGPYGTRAIVRSPFFHLEHTREL